MKIKAFVLAGMIASAVASQATLIVGDWTVIDDSDGGSEFSTTGTWISDYPDLYNDFADSRSFSNTDGDFAVWTFEGLTPGTYRVAASWTTSANRTRSADYTVQGIAMTSLDQRNDPVGVTLNDALTGAVPAKNILFQTLTSTAVVTGTGTLIVRLDVDDADFWIADAVAIQLVQVQVPEPSTLALQGFDLDPTLATRRWILSLRGRA